MSDLQPAAMPEGWAVVKLGDGIVDSIQSGFACGTHNREGDGVPHLRPMNVSTDGKIDLSDLKFVPAATVDRDERWITAGDVLFNNTNSPELVGKTAAYTDPTPRAFSNHMTRVRCRKDVLEPQYCALALHNLWQIGYFQDICNNHVSQASISRTVLLDTRIPLPPLAEQRRIVAQVEALMARVQSARRRLTRVPQLLKRFRQAVLAAACDGRLTADWREFHRASEFALDMVQRLRAIPPTLLDFPSDNWRSREANAVDSSSLPEIPSEWTWIRLPECGYMNRGRSRHRPRNAPHLYGGPYPFIQTGDIARSGGRITGHLQTYSEDGLAQSRLWPIGTICITIAANIADSAILTYPACFPDSVVGIVTDSQLCMPEYLEYFIRTARDNLSQFAPATAQKNINVSILGDVAVPLPPLAEQHEIARRVDALFRLADAIELRLTASAVRADKLTQSILAKASRGELVPTEAELARTEGRDYESADKLLASIAERSPESSAPSRRRRVIYLDVHQTIGLTQGATAMRSLTKEAVIAAIRELPTDFFSFEDLKTALPGDYEALKELMFSFLDDADSPLRQVFDEQAGTIRFERRQV